MWTTCNKPCGRGEETRTRICNFGPGCVGSASDKRVCQIIECRGNTFLAFKFSKKFVNKA